MPDDFDYESRLDETPAIAPELATIHSVEQAQIIEIESNGMNNPGAAPISQFATEVE